MILDSSALLAHVFEEDGARRVEDEFQRGASISSVNLAEVVAKLVTAGYSVDRIQQSLRIPRLTVLPFDAGHAIAAGTLIGLTRPLGLSLGDRCCIATAMVMDMPILTADRVWTQLDLGVTIELCR